MKLLKITILTLFLGLGITNMQAQIRNTNLNKPKIKPRISLPSYVTSTFDKIMYDLDHGICYKVAMVSLELDTKNVNHNSFNVETRHGKGFLVKDGNELKAIFPLQMGIKQTRYQQTVETTLRISKDRNNAKIDIRNSVYYHLIYDAKIVKKKNGYFINVEKNTSIKTVSFTFAIYKTPCLI